MAEAVKRILEYMFNIGDIVVTSDGKLGFIEDFCNCEQCAKRGFYEPIVRTMIGTDKIYITDGDIHNNFRSFYRIGNQIYGNIEKGNLEITIGKRESELKKLKEQLIILNNL